MKTIHNYREKTHKRFISNIEKLSNNCWYWNGYKTGKTGKEYGAFCWNGKQQPAHKYSFEYFNYPLKYKKPFVLDHLCRNRLCVNPKHLEVVTNKENILRGIGVTAINRKRRSAKMVINLTQIIHIYTIIRLV